MKSFILILVLSLCCNLPLSASEMSLSLKGGLSVSQQDWEYSPSTTFSSPDWDNYNGWTAGILIHRKITGHVSILTGLQYLRRGISIELQLTDYTSNILGTRNFREFSKYVSIPLMLQLRLPMSSMGLYLQGGISRNFEVGYESDFGTSNIFKQFSSVFDAIVGFGVEPVRFSRTAIFIDFLYSWDITDARKSESLTIRTRSFDVSIGFRYAFSQ